MFHLIPVKLTVTPLKTNGNENKPQMTRYCVFKYLSQNSHTETVDLSDNNVQ